MAGANVERVRNQLENAGPDFTAPLATLGELILVREFLELDEALAAAGLS